uniref:ion channel n=1 Tax=Trichocoleus desertorum TaxID=1481672 RepID=UPI0025B48674|nr:ion channel [Trichocoleus desertorum]
MRQVTIFRNWRTKRRSRPQPVVQIKIRDGQFHILGNGVWHSYWREPYHLLLTIPWTGFLALTVLCYGVTNAVFALLYLAQPASIANAKPGSFLDAFFFSVQTLASIGYGALYPQTVYANTLVTIEAMVSLVGIALLTGLAFARFSRPTARVSFSHVAVIGPYEGVPTFIFRTANQRRNQILEAKLRLYLMRDEMSLEGHSMRRFYELKLLRSHTPSFTLSWTVLHPIDQSSPFYGATPESLAQMRASVVVSLSGIDETVSQAIHARYTYGAQDILWNYCFVDIFHETADGHRYINYNHFHDVMPLP